MNQAIILDNMFMNMFFLICFFLILAMLFQQKSFFKDQKKVLRTLVKPMELERNRFANISLDVKKQQWYFQKYKNVVTLFSIGI